MTKSDTRRKTYKSMTKAELVETLLSRDHMEEEVTSARKHAEEALAEKEAQLRIVLDNLPSGFRYVDKDRRVMLFNQQYSQIRGFPDGIVKIGGLARDENMFLANRGDFGPGDPEDLVDNIMPKH